MATKILLRSRVPLEQVEARSATHPTHDDYDVLLAGDCKVYAPDGSLICALVRGGMDAELTEAAYPALHSLRGSKSDNRGKYAGQSERVVKVNDDNTVSRTLRSAAVRSSIIGYYDRYPRIPFCRETAFTAKKVEKWETVIPLIQQIGKLYKATIPGRYKIQAEFLAKEVNKDFVIAGSPFTTITVNNCVSAGYHQDKGDFKAGMGVLTCIRRGRYANSHLVIPRYRIAVDLQDRDVLFFDPHLWHGNIPMDGEGPEGKPDDDGWERISLVLYVREKMQACGTAAEEAELAKRNATGGKL